MSTATLLVTYDPIQVTPEQIIQAVEDLGYTVEGTFPSLVDTDPVRSVLGWTKQP